MYIICGFQELNVVYETKKSATLSTFILVAVVSRRKIHNVLYKKIEETIKVSDGYLFEWLGVNLSAILAFQLTLIS